MWVCVHICVKLDNQQFVWVGSLFWFLLFFSPFQCFPHLLCSKDKFGRFAKFITFHLLIRTSPLHPSSAPSSSSPSPSSPGYLYWYVGLLVCSPITSITDRFFFTRKYVLNCLLCIIQFYKCNISKCISNKIGWPNINILNRRTNNIHNIWQKS